MFPPDLQNEWLPQEDVPSTIPIFFTLDAFETKLNILEIKTSFFNTAPKTPKES